MKLGHTLFALAALCGNALWAGNGNTIDPTATVAVQYNVSFVFGPTSVLGAGACANPQTFGGVQVCVAQGYFNIPSGYRFVITNISGYFSYAPHTGSEILLEQILMIQNVANTTQFSTITTDHSQTVGDATYFYFNKDVHMFADSSINSPQLQLTCPQNVGPYFKFGTGGLTATFQGYLVPLP